MHFVDNETVQVDYKSAFHPSFPKTVLNLFFNAIYTQQDPLNTTNQLFYFSELTRNFISL